MKEGILKKSLTDAQGANNIPYLDENTEIMEREKVEGTPFEVIGNKETGYWVAFGMFRLTEQGTKEEAYNGIAQKGWDMIGNFIYAAMANRDIVNEQMKNKKQGE